MTHAPAQSGDVPEALHNAADLPRSNARQSRAPLSRFRGQFGRYATGLLWVIRDALPRFRTQVAAVITCNIIGLAAAFTAVGGVMAYARAAEHNRPMHILGYEWPLGNGIASLLLFGACIALFGVISAACTYISDRMILSSARVYHAFCTDRAIAIAADPLCRGWQTYLDDSPRAILSRMTGSASRIMGLMLRDLLRVILPMLTVLATIAFLFYIDVTMTLVLLPATALYLLPLYVINRRVTRMQREYRLLSPQARGEIGKRLRDMLHTGRMTEDLAALRLDTLNGTTNRGALAALYGRLLADRRVHLLNAAFFIVCLVALLIFFGVQARDQARPWSDLIFYILALRFAMSALKQTTSLGAKFSRFFPEYHAYAGFVDAADRTRARRAAALAAPPQLPDVLTLRLGKSGRWGSVRALRLRANIATIVLAPGPCGHADLEAQLLRIERRLDEDADLTTYAAFIAQADRFDPARIAAATIIAISGTAATRQRVIDAITTNISHRWLFIVHDKPADALNLPLLQTAGDARIVVSDGLRFIAGGDLEWFRTHIADIEAFLKELAATSKSGSAGDAALDDDDEDEDAE